MKRGGEMTDSTFEELCDNAKTVFANQKKTAKDIIKQQWIWLEKLQERSKKPILIKLIEGKWHKEQDQDADEVMWLYFKDVIHKATEPIYTRNILFNELCFDPDVKDWNILIEELNKIKTYCQLNKIPIQLAYSGGNGIHIHIWFNSFLIDKNIMNDFKVYDVDEFEIIRNILVDFILRNAGTNRKVLALDSAKVSFGRHSKGSMVREYGTTRPDGHFKTLIHEIPATKAEAQKLPLIFPEKVDYWTIPDEFNREINESIKKRLEKAKKSNEFKIDDLDLTDKKLEEFPCLKLLFKKGAVDGSRYYAANSITLMAKQCGYSWTTTQTAIKKLLSVCDISNEDAQTRIDNNESMFKSNKAFSCHTFKKRMGMGFCNFLECPLYDKTKTAMENKAEDEPKQIDESIKEEANRILDGDGTIQYLIDTYHTVHIGDEITGKLLITAIGSQSVKNSFGLQPKVSGGSGEGKTHAVGAVMHMVPEEYVLETTLSDKAIYHKKDIKPGTIIYSDDVNLSDVLQGIIKRATTHFQKYTTDTITVKKDGEFTTESLTIPPRIIWALTSVNDTGSLEFLNRQINLAVDESKEQDERVMKLQLKKAVSGDIDLAVTDQVLICREIIRTIKSKLFTVTIPYAERVIWNNPDNRRNLNQFLDIIKSFAVFNYRNRTKVNEDTIEANEIDFQNAVSLYTKRQANQRFKLNDNELMVLSKMAKGAEYDLKTLQVSTGLSYQTLLYLFNGRNGRTGLLEKVADLTTHAETLDLGEEESGYQDNVYIKMKVHRPRNVYILNRDFQDLSGYGDIATLKKGV